jgi:hypothetical protein
MTYVCSEPPQIRLRYLAWSHFAMPPMHTCHVLTSISCDFPYLPLAIFIQFLLVTCLCTITHIRVYHICACMHVFCIHGMSSKRRRCGRQNDVFSLLNTIVGGWANGDICTNDCERFDPKTGTWTLCAPLLTGRRSAPRNSRILLWCSKTRMHRSYDMRGCVRALGMRINAVRTAAPVSVA